MKFTFAYEVVINLIQVNCFIFYLTVIGLNLELLGDVFHVF